MTDEDASSHTPGVVARQDVADLELRIVGTAPWSLEGAYVTLSELSPSPEGAQLAVQALSFAPDRRVAFHGGQISISSRELGERVADVRRSGAERVQAARYRGRILLSVPSYGFVIVSSDLTLARTWRRVPKGQLSLLGADASGPINARSVRAILSPSELTLQLAAGRGPVQVRLDTDWPVRQFGIAGRYVIATAFPDGLGDPQNGQLGVASVEASRWFTWFPMELSREHQLLDVSCRDEALAVWISETPLGSTSSRVSSWSIDPSRRALKCVASYQLDAHGPFSLERAGGEAAHVYGLSSNREGRENSALARLDLQTGAVTLSASEFGSWLGTPVVAYEFGGTGKGYRPWLVVPVYDAMRDRAELTIREGRQLARAPVAFLQLPSASVLGCASVWI